MTGGGCSTVPEETSGPYPGDGSNGPNVLTTTGIVRSDIRSSFGSLTGTAAGIPLTINLTVTDSSNACKLLGGYAVYLWHCDREGRYSLYSSGATNQNYLRGVQATNSSGVATFKSIFPAAGHRQPFLSADPATHGRKCTQKADRPAVKSFRVQIRPLMAESALRSEPSEPP